MPMQGAELSDTLLRRDGRSGTVWSQAGVDGMIGIRAKTTCTPLSMIRTYASATLMIGPRSRWSQIGVEIALPRCCMMGVRGLIGAGRRASPGFSGAGERVIGSPCRRAGRPLFVGCPSVCRLRRRVGSRRPLGYRETVLGPVADQVHARVTAALRALSHPAGRSRVPSTPRSNERVQVRARFWTTGAHVPHVAHGSSGCAVVAARVTGRCLPPSPDLGRSRRASVGLGSCLTDAERGCHSLAWSQLVRARRSRAGPGRAGRVPVVPLVLRPGGEEHRRDRVAHAT